MVSAANNQPEPVPFKGPGRRAKYPWEEWMAFDPATYVGPMHTIIVGRDIHCRNARIAACMICRFAQRRGLTVQTRTDGIRLHFQIVGKRIEPVFA